MSAMRATQTRRLPGFGLTLGFTLFYVTLMIVIPIAALLFKASSISMQELVETFKTPRVQASLRLTFGASLLAATINTLFGFIVAVIVSECLFNRQANPDLNHSLVSAALTFNIDA